jgi:hydrogenase small subunit
MSPQVTGPVLPPGGPSSELRAPDGLLALLRRRGISRRAFLGFCAAMTATLALPGAYTSRVAAAVATAPRVPLVWLRGLACGGDGEALLRVADPGVAELLLDLLSVDALEALSASAPGDVLASIQSTTARYPHGYLAVIEGAIPTAQDAFLTIAGRPFRDLVETVCDGAIATIAVGACAVDGGVSAAAGGRTGAIGAASLAGRSRFVALPGCPVNPANLAATLVHYLTFQDLPATDSRGLPLFAYGALIHNQCERRPHFEFGEFVQAWGDEGAQKGWCLYRMGCKGPQTFNNCPTVRYDDTSWPVKAGVGCIGCSMPAFWDTMSPFEQRLPDIVPFAPQITVDQAGAALVGGVGALATVHGLASIVRLRRAGAGDRKERGSDAEALAVEPTRAVEQPTAIEQPLAVEVGEEPAPTVEEPMAVEPSVAVDTSVAPREPDRPVLGEPSVSPEADTESTGEPVGEPAREPSRDAPVEQETPVDPDDRPEVVG